MFESKLEKLPGIHNPQKEESTLEKGRMFKARFYVYAHIYVCLFT